MTKPALDKVKFASGDFQYYHLHLTPALPECKSPLSKSAVLCSRFPKQTPIPRNYPE